MVKPDRSHVRYPGPSDDLSGTKKSPIGVLIGTLLKELLISKKRTDIVLGKNIIVYNKNDFKKII